MLKTYSLLATLTIFGVFSCPAFAGNCAVSSICTANTQCDAAPLFLEWSAETRDSISIDGETYTVKWIDEPERLDEIKTATSTWEIRTLGPVIVIMEAGYFGAIRPTNDPGQISITLAHAPKKYVDYAEAFAMRRVFGGKCEGLF